VSLDTLQRGRPATFGAEIAKNFGLNEEVVFVTPSPPKPQFAAIEYRVDDPHGGLSEIIPPEDAYIVSVQLGGAREKNYWEEGRHVGRYGRVTGDSSISDLRREPRILIDLPVHSLLFYLPRASLNALARDAGLSSLDDLSFDPGVGFRDDTFWGLGQALLPTLRAPEQANRLFTDYVALALASHVASAYGGRDIARPIRGGLAPWQEKRAKAMMLADLAGRQSLDEVAAACGLSSSHFARSFRKTTGHAPHAWLVRARVQQAMVRLRRRDETVASVAVACGFADPSHFARVFTRQVGLSPSAWRRLAMR
jgi:AraC family transcriptional regulator